MTQRRAGNLFAALVGVLLITTVVVSAWILVTSGALGASGTELGEPGRGSVDVDAAPLLGDDTVRVTAAFQLSQPRDPFRPLITPDSPIAGIPGVGGTPGSGGDDGNGGYTPGTTTVTLQEIRDVNGVLRATVVVNGVSYDVGVGDTFAGSYKVVSLTTDRGVFMFGDKAFDLGVGQQILK
jgi:hypothetical protein